MPSDLTSRSRQMGRSTSRLQFRAIGGVSISQIDFVPYVTLAYFVILPHAVDISALPEGDTMRAVSAWDGSTPALGVQPFTKTAGQVRLLLTP